MKKEKLRLYDNSNPSSGAIKVRQRPAKEDADFDRDTPVSLAPLSAEQALRSMLSTPPE